MAISGDVPKSTVGVADISPCATAKTAAVPLSSIHIGALDGIRGIAILLVLAFHYGDSARSFDFQSPILKASAFGWSGVDLFFVLSGFLITGILYESRNSKDYFRNFYARRILRIFPLYYGALLVVVLLSTVWPQAGLWGTHSSLWIAFYLTNFTMASEGPAAIGLLAHYWSLAIEEHFYLVWPLFVLWGTRRQLMVGAAALALIALALRTALVLWGWDREAIYVLTPTRMDALAIGALCSLVIKGPNGVAGILRPAAVVMLVSGVALIAIMLLRRTVDNHDAAMQTAGFTLIALYCGATIIVGITWQPLKDLLNHAILRWFGRYSYGLYVWHPIVNVILFSTAVKTAVGVEGKLFAGFYLLFAFILVLAIAVASYTFFEKPFLRLKRGFV